MSEGNGNGSNGNGKLPADNSGKFAPGNPFAFKPGRSGNPGGRPALPGHFARALHKIPPEKWRKVINAQIKAAMQGDSRAFASLARYLLPELPRDLHMEMTGGAGQPLTIRIERIQEWRSEGAVDRLPPHP